MTPESITEIQSRLRRVERQNRFLLIGCVGVASVALFTAATKAPSQTEVRAHRFILVDAQDKPIGSWAAEKGYAVLDFDKDQLGNQSVHMAETPEGGEIFLVSNSRGRAHLTATSKEANLLLSGGGSTPDNGSISLLGGERSVLAMSDAQKAQIHLSPGSSSPFYAYGPQSKRQWSFAGDRFSLFGMKLEFCDLSGHILQTLPSSNSVPPSSSR